MNEASAPSRNWGDIATEIGIIVVGVLIALAAEQTVRSIDLGQRANAAEEAMALEIENSLLAAAELTRLDRCWEVQILALKKAIAGGDRGSAREIIRRGSVFGVDRHWADNAFQAALSAQVSDYLGAEKLKRYSQVYDMIRDASVMEAERWQTQAELETLLIDGLPETPEITYSQLKALSQLNASKVNMLDQGEAIATFAKKDLGLEVTRAAYLAARGRVRLITACENDARFAQELHQRVLPDTANVRP